MNADPEKAATLLSVISVIHRLDNLKEILETYVWQSADKNYFEIVFGLTNPATDIEAKAIILQELCDKGLSYTITDCLGESNCVARNKLAKQAHGNILVFVDGDVLLHPSMITEHMKLGSNQVGIGIANIDVRNFDGELLIALQLEQAKGYFCKYASFGKVTFQQITNYLGLERALELAKVNNQKNLTDYLNVSGRNFSIFRTAFFEIGMFNVDLEYSVTSTSRGWEDTALGCAAYEHKMDFVQIPSWVVHPVHTSSGRIDVDTGFGNAIKLVKKYPWIITQRPDWFERVNYNIEEFKHHVE